MSTITPYRQAKVTVGHLEEQTISAVFMPRADFLDVVQATLDSDDDYLPIADKILETAWSVQRFPMGAWIHSTRGCGCLIGEMLVAHDVFEEYNRRIKAGIPVIAEEVNEDARRNLAERGIESTADIKSLLRERYPKEHVNVLKDFGERIDSELHNHLSDTTPGWHASTIIIEDG
jgi:hypothetical protein